MSKKFAFVFPGQGSQYPGMLAELAQTYPIVTQLFEQASALLGYDLWRVSQEGPQEQLNSTECTQPALLVAGVAVWRIWQSLSGATPNYLAGHSLGEYTALVCAEALDFEVAVKLVAARGQYMQEAVPMGVGAMAAIVGLEDQQVQQICKEACTNDEDVTPANYNSIGQIVIAGHATAVDRAIQQAKAQGAKIAKKLPMSVPSHCALMKPAAIRLRSNLDQITFQTPKLPVVNNVDVAVYQDQASICDGLQRQLYSPVRWIETVQYLVSQGVDLIIEAGPGKVLSGLNKRIASDLNLVAITDLASLQDALRLVLQQTSVAPQL